MFISIGDRVFTGFAVTGLAVLAWGALLFVALRASDAEFWVMFTCPLVGLTAYACSMAVLPEAQTDE